MGERATRTLSAGAEGIAEAARTLAAGGLVAFPTETVYGLGADATDPGAVAGIYAAKGRPSFNPLIAHVADIEAALALGEFGPEALKLAEAFWPGPLTLVVPANDACPVCDLARAGLASVAIRVPDHPVAQALLRVVGRPIAAPSANRSGHVSPSTAEHVIHDLSGAIDAVIDAGAVPIGVESTILACLDGTVTLLRPGGLERDQIEKVIGKPLLAHWGDAVDLPLAPGRLASHYAPRAPIRLNAQRVSPGEACLAFGQPPDNADPALTLNLSPDGNLGRAAANLYTHLRALDRLNPLCIAVMPIPKAGLGEAILDRLVRAASPR